MQYTNGRLKKESVDADVLHPLAIVPKSVVLFKLCLVLTKTQRVHRPLVYGKESIQLMYRLLVYGQPRPVPSSDLGGVV